jgi:hypothetical protein
MPSQHVGCDPDKLVPNDKYEEYVTERPSLIRKPGFANTSTT